MTAALKAFVKEIREDQRLADLGDLAEAAVHFLTYSDETGAIEMTDSLDWIFRQPRTLREKVVAIGKLLDAEQTLPAGAQVSMKELTGWT
jgi:hypothetical protein